MATREAQIELEQLHSDLEDDEGLREQLEYLALPAAERADRAGSGDAREGDR